MNIRVTLFTALLLALFCFSATEGGWEQKIAPALLAELETGQSLEFLVRFKPQADLSRARKLPSKARKGQYVFEQTRRLARQTQGQAREILNSAQAPYRSFFVVNAIHCRGGLRLARQLAQLEEVDNLQPNPKVALDMPAPPPETAALNFREGVEWGIAAIGADQVWSLGYTGQGVVIGGQDTGVEWGHPALKETYRGWDGASADHNYNWHDAIHNIDSLNGPPYLPAANPCGLSTPVPCDDHNHGTHTIGTMTGSTSDQGTSIGVAPDAKWIACRNMERGYGSPASYIECFEWFLAPTNLAGENPDPEKAPHVIANSWSCPELEGCTPANFETMAAVVNTLKAAGIVVVVSAGNSGSECHTVSTPAAIFEHSFSVGATRQNDTIANFSSRGTVTVDGSGRLKPNVAAPGVGVRSSIRNGGFATYSGTSMAGPHVAGAVALIISARPELAGQVETIESLLESTARPMLSTQDCGGVPGMSVPNAVYGHGRIDVRSAVEAALEATPTKGTEQKGPIVASPNPVQQTLTLIAPRPFHQDQPLQLLDLSGRVVQSVVWPARTAQLQLKVQHLPNGVYLYRLGAKDQVHTGRLIKQ